MQKALSTVCSFTTTITATLLMAGVANAGFGDLIVKILPTDIEQGDFFGRKVAMSGSTTMVGNDSKGGGIFSTEGTAYLFDTKTGSQIARLRPSDTDTIYRFGVAIDICGPLAIVGADGDNSAGLSAGSAYLFDSVSGAQVAKLIPHDLNAIDSFGRAVAISEKFAVVAAPGDDDRGEDSGSLYVFDLATGSQVNKIYPVDSERGMRFGSPLMIDGDTIIVGSINSDDNGPFSGAVYLFDVNTGDQIAKLLPHDGDPGDLFGFSVGISGTNIIVGAHGDDEFAFDFGAAYLFDLNTGAQTAKLLPSGQFPALKFGLSVAIGGTTATVGANPVHVFDIYSGALIDTFLTPNIGGLSLSPIAVGDEMTAVGLSSNNSSGNNFGGVFVYEAGSFPALTGDVANISIGTGGQQVLTLDAGSLRANSIYTLFGSSTGTTPGITFESGTFIPLNFDRYFKLTQSGSALGTFQGQVGQLDVDGRAIATLTIPAGLPASLAGLTLHHAYLAGDDFFVPEFVSNAISVTFVP